MPPAHIAIAAKLDQIEAGMKRIGSWQDGSPPEEAFEFTRAFAADTMSFGQWLQFILIPRVRELLAAGGPFPDSSHVGAQAVREFDGDTDADELVRLLSEFDALFDG